MRAPSTLPGQSFPLGSTLYPEGVNFSIFSKNAILAELLLFDADDHRAPAQVFQLNPRTNKTFYYWHIFVPGIREGQLYGWRFHGPFEPEQGYRYDGQKVLIDPYARAVEMRGYDRQAACSPGDNCAQAIKSVVVGPSRYDWEGDKPLNRPYAETIIYELHLGGFTKHPSSGVAEARRGTFHGLIEKIPYLQKLGITAVELLPVQQFDPSDVPNDLTNYWGYSPIAFFAPHHAYASSPEPLARLDEFKDLVKALHRAGIEVILDVVFNHTGEGDAQGPTLSFKGLENRAYYLLEKDGAHYYHNFAGTGNTLNANHSVVRRMIMDCLRYWVAEMHIDGFRFDLASVLSRDEAGHPAKNPPILWSIESDPVLAPAKIIAEAWDVAQYQVGSFIGDKWAEWNGRYRDDIRRFVKGERGMVRAAAERLSGSPKLFRKLLRDPNRSINFVTCHDGFTLNDLVSYNHKHNLANQEGNRDGTDANHSWNCGWEGPARDPAIEALRQQQIKNFLALLLLSQGTPMLLMGDELRRTQLGNNNAYCQDNELSWFDWRLTKSHADLLGFTQRLIAFNLGSPYYQEQRYWDLNGASEGTTCHFHGTRLGQPDWSEHSHSLAFTLENAAYDHALHVMLNFFWEPLSFELPELPPGLAWRRIIDTAAPPPFDCCSPPLAPTVTGQGMEVKARSVAVAWRPLLAPPPGSGWSKPDS
jgi:isoamylase